MKSSFLALTALANSAAAFPAIAEAVARSADANTLEGRQQQGGFHEPTPGFNAAQQHVSTTGKYKFVAPDLEGGDARGPCPGLNALANHGYLPHNGVATNAQFIEATFKGFGMAADLSGFLTVFGSTMDGDGKQWSIGGPSKALPGLPPLLGVPQGISGSHNKYESDVSPGRGDLYKYGNDYELQMSQFQELYDMGQAAGDEYTLETLQAFRAKRFQDSISTNPYFFNGPFTGVLVQPAAYTFIYRFMGNKSAEHPNGYLDGNTLMSFFGVKKDSSGKLIKEPGHERFPNNWYKRAIGDGYSIELLNADTLVAATKYPQFLTIGGNTGKVNTLTGVAPGDIMSGVTDSKSLLQGNNLACFAMQFAAQTSPDLIKCSGVLADVEAQSSKLNNALSAAITKLQCPKLGKPNESQFSQFPGFSKLNCKTGEYGEAS